jgi:xylulose-5-phosphate/fructose-6-phosphate phosphoketolase
MNSYKPEELFNADGSLKDELKAIAPKGDKRMSANPITNGGRLIVEKAQDLKLPDWRQFTLTISQMIHRGTELLKASTKHGYDNTCQTIWVLFQS